MLMTDYRRDKTAAESPSCATSLLGEANVSGGQIEEVALQFVAQVDLHVCMKGVIKFLSGPGPLCLGLVPEDQHEARADVKCIDHVIALVMHTAIFSDQPQPARPLERFYLQLFGHLVAVHDPD